MKKSVPISFVIFVLAASFCNAESQKKHTFGIDVGAYTTNLEQRLKVPSGYVTSDVSSLLGYLRLRHSISLSKVFNFTPSLGSAIPGIKNRDGSTRTFLSHLNLNMGMTIFSWLHFFVGPGIHWGWIYSTGQAVDLNNGSSTTTSTFYTPDRDSHYFLITLQSGLNFQIGKRWVLGTEVIALTPFNKARRRFNLALTIGVNL